MANIYILLNILYFLLKKCKNNNEENLGEKVGVC